jgi:hypothetical protein
MAIFISIDIVTNINDYTTVLLGLNRFFQFISSVHNRYNSSEGDQPLARPLMEMRTRNIPVPDWCQELKAGKLTVICERTFL